MNAGFENLSVETDWLKRWNSFSPQAVAVKDADSGVEMNYSFLYKASCQLALHLAERFEIKKGDRVAMISTNEIEFIPLFFAVQRLGAILVPINFRLTAPETCHILNDSSPKLLIFHEDYRALLENLGPGVLPDRRWSLNSDDGLKNWLRETSSLKMSEAQWQMPIAMEFSDACMILYTSGTTGFPKGAVITHEMLFWNSVNTGLRLNLTQDDATVSFLPFFHTAGWNVLNTPILHRGGRLIFIKKFDPVRVLELCQSEKATILFGVPTTMDMMFNSDRFAEVDLSTIRYAIVGGEPMPIELIKGWQKKGVPIRQGFGLTEFGPNVFSLSEKDSLRKIGSIGSPNFYIDVRVADDRGQDVKRGETGELLLRGPVCMAGYWNNPKATAETIKDGWLHTGDLVRQDEDGYFYVAGRKKDMFISGGENVYPVEVERVLSTHPQIREVAVIGVPDEKWGEVGKAYIAMTEGAKLTLEDVIGFCTTSLARFKIPKHVQFVNELPKGDSGKILKRKLKEALEHRVC